MYKIHVCSHNKPQLVGCIHLEVYLLEDTPIPLHPVEKDEKKKLK